MQESKMGRYTPDALTVQSILSSDDWMTVRDLTAKLAPGRTEKMTLKIAYARAARACAILYSMSRVEVRFVDNRISEVKLASNLHKLDACMNLAMREADRSTSLKEKLEAIYGA